VPIHDWTRVSAGLFHNFHQRWISALCDALNFGGLPPEYFALTEQRAGGPIPVVLTLKLSDDGPVWTGDTGIPVPVLAVAEVPPKVSLVQTTEARVYARKADRITIRHQEGDVVAVIEIVSPGNKASQAALREFVQKTSDLIQQRIHLLVVDLFPPGRRDPEGIHRAIWDELEENDHAAPPPDKPLVLASYDAGPPILGYVDSKAVGEPLPEMPLFLRPGFYVPAPLEATYQTSWDAFPPVLKHRLQL
jgi:hypothetical protein